MQKEYLIELGDAVVAVKNADGQIKLNQLINLTAAGAASGALWGTLAGLIFLMPLVGTAIGAASGALGARLTDVGINDQFMKDARRTATWHRRAVPPHSEDDDGQGSCRPTRRRRHGNAHVL